jgi:hypothetical protein
MEEQEQTNELLTTTNTLDRYCFDPLWMLEIMEKEEQTKEWKIITNK